MSLRSDEMASRAVVWRPLSQNMRHPCFPNVFATIVTRCQWFHLATIFVFLQCFVSSNEMSGVELPLQRRNFSV